MTKSKSTKRAMLGSAISLVLCFAMLLGTTFAWFTDSVTSMNNVIKSGNLDIDVQYTLDGENWADLGNAGNLFEDDLWEPGFTKVVALKITNTGSLALKYNANMNIVSEIPGVNKAGETFYLSDILTVSTLIQQANDENGFGDVALGLAFNGENSVRYEKTTTFKESKVLGADYELQPGDEHYVIVKVDMAETVGNEANAKDQKSVPSINFGINVLATQFTYENDSFGNQYDKEAEYDYWDGSTTDTELKNEDDTYYISSAAELAGLGELVKNGNTFAGKTVVLTNDIDLWNASWTPIGAFGASDSAGNPSFNGTFDGNGHTIKNLYIGEEYADKDGVGLFASNAVYHDIVIENLTVDGATVYGNKWVGVIQGYTMGTVTNCTVKNATVYANTGYRAGAVVGFVANSTGAVLSAGTATNNKAENCTIYVSKTVSETNNAVVGTDTSKDAATNIGTNKATNCNVVVGATVIKTAADLFDFANDVNVNKNTYAGKTVVLANDIDLKNAPWTPIGAFGASDSAADPSFNGTFDGNGHTVKNLYIGEEYADKDGVGLFASNAVYDDIVIKNLSVDGATVYGHKWVGVIQGYTMGTVTNCTVKNATVYANTGYRAGAVVGFVTNSTGTVLSAGTVTNNKAENCTIYVSKTVSETNNAVVGTDTSKDAAANIGTNTATNCNVVVK